MLQLAKHFFNTPLGTGARPARQSAATLGKNFVSVITGSNERTARHTQEV